MANSVDAAEKEASEVLHSLLSVERIVSKHDVRNQNVTTIQSSDNKNDLTQQAAVVADGPVIDPGSVQWQGNVAISTNSIFTDHFPQTIDEQVHDVVWQGHTIHVETAENDDINLYTNNDSPTLEDNKADLDPLTEDVPLTRTKKSSKRSKSKSSSNVKSVKCKKRKETITHNEPTKLEENAAQVKERFKRGCECQDESCFRGLSPESVYRHRLNIAELTKGEHDMYLMGVTMACLANPDTTVRHKERQRLRAQYVYQGRRVCLDAFLYLENCTHYQLKRIRKHVMTHGVAPRVHGNHGKKPHNTFSLEIYRHATQFLKQYLETHNIYSNSKTPIQLPWDITRKNLHNAYKEYGQILDPGVKLMGYSTFRHFLKEQFPHVRFCKMEPKNAVNILQTSTVTNRTSTSDDPEHSTELKIQQLAQQTHANSQIEKNTVIPSGEVQQVIPLVVQQDASDSGTTQHQQTTFLVTPVSQLLSGGSNLVTMPSTSANQTSNTFPYQIANTGYVINEQGNIVTTMANQHQTYSFSRM